MREIGWLEGLGLHVIPVLLLSGQVLPACGPHGRLQWPFLVGAAASVPPQPPPEI